MDDICDLILDDHDDMRRRFAALDTKRGDHAALTAVWGPLADLLDLHAAAEEDVFYPCLLREGKRAEEETRDAIKDHNEIRDAVAKASEADVGTDEWWHSVTEAREHNSEHMAEEERGALADFRANSDPGTRRELGSRFRSYREQHGGNGIPRDDVDPDDYIERRDRQGGPRHGPPGSL